MIPAHLDFNALIADLEGVGLCRSKIEYLCGFSECYLSHVTRGKISDMTYRRAAKLYNLHAREVGQKSLPIAGTTGQIVV